MIIFIETKEAVFGGQQALLARCAELDALDQEYIVVHPYAQSLFLDEYKRRGIRGKLLCPLNRFKKYSPSWLSFVLSKVSFLARKFNKVIVHADAFDSAYLAAALSAFKLLGNGKILFTVRSERYLRFNFLDRLFLRWIDHIATNSEFSRRLISLNGRIAEDAISITYSPINFSEMLRSIKGGELTIKKYDLSFMGSFEGRKRIDRFVGVAVKLAKSIPERDLRFGIFGAAKDDRQDTVLAEQLELIRASGFEDRFEVVGYLPVWQAAALTKFLVCPFENEPLGRVVPEFIYLGVPVFINNSGGLEEAGAGLAHVVSFEEGDAAFSKFRERFLELDRENSNGEDLSKNRLLLEAKFGSKAVVGRELEIYNNLFNCD